MTETHRVPVDQWTQDDVHRLYVAEKYDEIEEVRKAGHLASILGADVPYVTPKDQQWSADDLHDAYQRNDYEAIPQARENGQLNTLLGITE